MTLNNNFMLRAIELSINSANNWEDHLDVLLLKIIK